MSSEILRDLVAQGLKIDSRRIVLSGELPQKMGLFGKAVYFYLLSPHGVVEVKDEFSKGVTAAFGDYEGLNKLVQEDTIAIILETADYGGKNRKFKLFKAPNFKELMDKEAARWEQFCKE